MSRTSESEAFSEIYDLITALPIEVRQPIFERFIAIKDTPEWVDRYNHELLWHCYNEHQGLDKDVFRKAAEEYQETLHAMELWEELL